MLVKPFHWERSSLKFFEFSPVVRNLDNKQYFSVNKQQGIFSTSQIYICVTLPQNWTLKLPPDFFSVKVWFLLESLKLDKNALYLKVTFLSVSIKVFMNKLGTTEKWFLSMMHITFA